jgi:hypothetical protein
MPPSMAGNLTHLRDRGTGKSLCRQEAVWRKQHCG